MSTEPRIERRAATEHAQKREKILGFIRSARELQPLLSGVSFDSRLDKEECMVEFADIVQKHKHSLELLIDAFNLDQSVPDDSKLITLLSIELSNIERSFKFSDGSSKYIKSVASILTELTVRRQDLADLQKDIAFDADIVACVKVSLFKAAYEFSMVLDGLKATSEERQRWQHWLHSTSVALGKDVAFNFDQHGTFRDRELLFRECLPMCTQIAISVWKEQFAKTAKSKLKKDGLNDISEPSKIIDGMSDLKMLLKQQDMGYKNHKTTNLEWLEKQIGFAIFGIIESFDFSEFNSNDIINIKAVILEMVENYCINAWQNASTKTVDEIRSKLATMSEAEINEWKEKEGSNPMPFSKFKSELMSEMEMNKSVISLNKLVEADLTRATRGSLAHLWGFSDAFCRIKRELPI